jgi:hypothetical protein
MAVHTWTVITFTGLIGGSHQPFEVHLRPGTEKVCGIAAFSSQLHQLPQSGVTLKLGLQMDNQRIFTGNPVFVLGRPVDAGVLSPPFVEIDQRVSGTYLNGFIHVINHDLTDPLEVQLYIKTC